MREGLWPPPAGTRCYTVRTLCISTLHVSLIIRVLPRAESATGWHLSQAPMGRLRIMAKALCFRSIRRYRVTTTALDGSGIEKKLKMSAKTPLFLAFSRSSHICAGYVAYHPVIKQKPRRTASRPLELRRQGPVYYRISACPPLLAAFATIAAIIKCFKSIKNCYHSRHDDYNLSNLRRPAD